MRDEMDPKLQKQVVAEIYKRYPEFAGCKPKVRLQNSVQGQKPNDRPKYLLTLQGTAIAKSSTGKKKMSRYLRVVVDYKGKILKVTTSR